MSEVNNSLFFLLSIFICFFSYTNNFLNKKLNRWTQKWITIDEDKKIKHIQKFFRILLSDNKTTFYYSFCHNDLVERDWKWHCIKCNKCKYFIYLYINHVNLF
jgi:hypothetical protein